MDQQQNSTFTNQSLIDEQIFEKLVESKQFLNDQFLVQLFEKSINLGFSWEITKQTLRKYLLQLPLFEIKPKLDFKLLIDEEKFIEQLIMLSIQVDAAASAAANQSNKVSNQHNLLMDDENEDDNLDSNGEFDANFDDFDQNSESQFTAQLHQQFQHQLSLQQQQSQLQPQQMEVKKARAITNVSANLLNKLSNKPSISKLEQEHQEFVKESMNRINDKSNLRPIIIDSEDVGCSGNKQIFSLSRVKQVADFFEKKNHKVYVIMSLKRKEQIMMNNNSSNLLSQPSGSNTNLAQVGTDSSISSQQSSSTTQNTVNNNQPTQATTQDQIILQELDKKNLVHYTPYKRIGCKSIMYNVESAMLQFAASKKAIIVSNNNFRRFLNQSDEYKQVIEERVLMYSFIDDTFMPAEDPLGKNGPSLNNFLRFEPFANQQYMKRCPYKKKCTYGSKCKFWHPERGDQSNQMFKTAHQSVVEEAQEQKSKFKIILNRQINNRSPSPSNPLIKQLENATKEFNAEQLLIQHNNKVKYLQSSMAPSATASFLQLSEQQNQRTQLLRSMGPNDPRAASISATSASTAGILSNFKPPKFDTDLINTDLLIKSSQLKLEELKSLEQYQSSLQQMNKNKSEDLLLNSNIVLSKFQVLSQHHQDVSSSLSDNDNDKNLSNHKLSSLVNVNTNSISSTINGNNNNSNNRAELRSCLISRFNKEIADKVLDEYKEETDIEKLIFLAEGFDFDL